MCLVVLFVVGLLSSCVLAQESDDSAKNNNLVLGAIINKDAPYIKEILEICGEMYNFRIITKEVSERGKIKEISHHVCELAQEGVLGIIDAVGGRASETIQALADVLELPHVMVQHCDWFDEDWTFLNFFPSPQAYNTLLQEIIIHKEWMNFTILYVRGHSVMKISELMEMGNHSYRYTVALRELSGNDYRDVLINAKQNGYVNFVVDCPSENIELILDHAQQVGLMADEHSYIFVSPDLFSLDLTDYRYGGVNITGFRITKLNNPLLWDITDRLNNQTFTEQSAENLKTTVILIHDVILAFSEAMGIYARRNLSHTMVPQSLDCENIEPWAYGSTLYNFLRTNTVKGLTGKIVFDGDGFRSKVAFDVLELTPAGNESIGSWDFDHLTINRTQIPDAELGEESVLNNKTLKVLIALLSIAIQRGNATSVMGTFAPRTVRTPPYAYTKLSKNKLEGNDRYEGFTIDLIDMLSKKLGFSYVFQVQPAYGKKLDNGSFNGMVLDLIEDRADLAITDLTITKQRQEGIDFSTPFMTLGISIIYKEPSKLPPGMFSFMAVFSKEVWIYMMLIQFCLGIMMIFVGRISNKEWQNPVPCVEQPDELSNQFSFANSVWLIIGSVMQQGSEIAPIALAPRLITSVWWFFTLVMVASYVGTLVAFLTIETNSRPFDDIVALYNLKSIAYGVKLDGSTYTFFQDSKNPMYKDMFHNMEKNKWIVSSNDEGIERAEKSDFAFFMESTSIEFYRERFCDLIQVGGLLDTKTYGIGMKKQSPFKRDIDDALLKFKEQGDIQKLKDIWWKEKRGGGKCGEKQDEDKKQLDMTNMVGAFVVLGVGCIIGIIISILDMMWGVFKRSVKYGTTFKFELIEELKFAISFSGNTKPVKRGPKTIEGSAEALAELEGKDEVRSLKSIGSGKSTSTHKTTHSHSSRHSSRSLSVAFARRRKYS